MESSINVTDVGTLIEGSEALASWLEDASDALVALVEEDGGLHFGFSCEKLAGLAFAWHGETLAHRATDDEIRATNHWGHEIVALANSKWDNCPADESWHVIHPISWFVAVSRLIASTWAA